MIAFIIGAPRSGTTIISRCLDLHPEIAHFYEPYYIWDYYQGHKSTDIRTSNDLTPKAINFIRKNYCKFSKKASKPVIVDKLPENSYRFSFINTVFPNAKWIHVVRDGRDVTLSINKEWKKREKTVKERDYKYNFYILKRMFRFQPYWRFRILQIFYELRSGLSINPSYYLNKSKWKGLPGWGPRFANWEDAFQKYSLIQFNALQWLKTVDSAQKGLEGISRENVLVIHYERFVKKPKDTLKVIFDFLKCRVPENFHGSIPTIYERNFFKWKTELSDKEINAIGPLLSLKLIELGYDSNSTWYESA